MARLLGLGATTVDVGQGAGRSWVVMADPEGNEFDVLRTLAVPDRPLGEAGGGHRRWSRRARRAGPRVAPPEGR